MDKKTKKDYSQGKIYKIEPVIDHDDGDIYVGSTTKKYLSQRFAKHKIDYKRWQEGKRGLTKSYELFEKYGIDNCKIILLENIEAKDYNELAAREAHHIKILKCLNKVIPLRSNKEHYADNKVRILERCKQYREENKDKLDEYRENNKEKIAEQRKKAYEDDKENILKQKQEYYLDNRDKILENTKKYNKENIDKIRERKKQSYYNSKDKILAKDKELFKCECGSECRIKEKQRHFRTNKHLEFICNSSRIEEMLKY